MKTVKYVVRCHGSKQNDVVKLILKTFPKAALDISREKFPLNELYCHLYVTEDLMDVQAIFRNFHMEDNPTDCDLVLWQDIETIPLMNYALSQAKG